MSISEAIERIFRKDTFIVKMDEYGRYEISTGDNDCLTITIDRSIHIDKLKKCGYGGTELLFLVEELAKELNIQTISLSDGSLLVYCGDDSNTISLKRLKILTKGVSWYNSLGYVSDNFQEEKRHNTLILKMSFAAAWELATEKTIDTFIRENSRESMNEYLQHLREKLELLNENEPTKQLLRAIARETRKFHETQVQLDNYDEFIETNISAIQINNDNLMVKATELLPDVMMETQNYVDRLYNLMNMFHNTDSESCNKYEIFGKLLVHLSTLLKYDYNLKKNLKKSGGKRIRSRKKYKLI